MGNSSNLLLAAAASNLSLRMLRAFLTWLRFLLSKIDLFRRFPGGCRGHAASFSIRSVKGFLAEAVRTRCSLARVIAT